jgi:hypothetical protein
MVREKPQVMGLLDKLKKHWLGGIIILVAACVGVTWTIANELLVKPRDFTIKQQEIAIADLREKIKDPQDKKGKGASGSTLASATPPKTKGLNLPGQSTPSAKVLAPTWIYEGRPLLIFDDQVLIKVSMPFDFIKSASIDIELPSEKIHWGQLGVGKTETFTYHGQTYFFRIIEVNDLGAKITIAKKL